MWRSGPANGCSTPRSEGKGREDKGYGECTTSNKGWEKGKVWDKGKGGVGKGGDKGKEKGSVTCSHCGEGGHDPSRCYALRPERLPWKGASNVGCNYNVDENGCMLEFCGLETSKERLLSKRDT